MTTKVLQSDMPGAQRPWLVEVSTSLFFSALGIAALVCASSTGAEAQAAAAERYAAMAPIEQYRTASQAEEIALARSAAPASISDKAEILTLGAAGYETAVKGTNGFVCIVQRAWASDFADAQFWNPRLRAPNCFNPAAARSVVPAYLTRTKWVLEGASKSVMLDRTKAAVAAGQITPPEVGAMCYMMSKLGYLSDDAAGPWHAHLMFFVPKADAASWGANLAGSPVIVGDAGAEPVTVFLVPVAIWSDGTSSVQPAPMKM
ncbi:MAG: hypothetical protein WC729_12490 [Sphingomonas sp.]|jgi:hypothetical protein|uniref:hypothetical protein n=1 Tax=Sphingomonas sp. TaxID=28214 RepID=UPI0035619E06